MDRLLVIGDDVSSNEFTNMFTYTGNGGYGKEWVNFEEKIFIPIETRYRDNISILEYYISPVKAVETITVNVNCETGEIHGV